MKSSLHKKKKTTNVNQCMLNLWWVGLGKFCEREILVN